ncbi:MAG: hypothetical protein O2895_03605 [Chloroflexi bacterium]|nr:hypothetical protein [Chloroflexota bacterium]
MLSVRRMTYLVGAVGLAALSALAVALLAGSDQANDAPTVVAASSPELGGSGYLRPRPSSLADLVSNAQLVVIGQFGSVPRQTEEFGIGPPPPTSPGAPPFPTLAYSYFAVEVESVLGGARAASPGDEIVVRITGAPQHTFQSGNIMLMPQTGDRLLLVLSWVPELPDAYLVAPYGIFNIDGSEAVYSDRERTPVRGFTDQTRVPEFVEALKAAVAGRP